MVANNRRMLESLLLLRLEVIHYASRIHRLTNGNVLKARVNWGLDPMPPVMHLSLNPGAIKRQTDFEGRWAGETVEAR